METTIRGILEKEIESITNPDNLRSMSIRFQNLLTKSVEDSLFGYVVGFLLGRFMSLIYIKIRTESVADAETREFWEMIEKRTMYIKGRIKLALGK